MTRRGYELRIALPPDEALRAILTRSCSGSLHRRMPRKRRRSPANPIRSLPATAGGTLNGSSGSVGLLPTSLARSSRADSRSTLLRGDSCMHQASRSIGRASAQCSGAADARPIENGIRELRVGNSAGMCVWRRFPECLWDRCTKRSGWQAAESARESGGKCDLRLSHSELEDWLVPLTGLEPVTPSLRMMCSTN